MSSHKKSHAREGRGLGNGYNDNWRNSPLWDNIDLKKSKCENLDKSEDDIKEVHENKLDELSERERMRRLMSLAH